jgi:hypothetical protein
MGSTSRGFANPALTPRDELAGWWKSDSRGIDTVIDSYYHAPDVSEGSDPMRGPDDQTSGMFSYLSPEQRVRPDHPLRAIRQMTDAVFARLSPRFTKMYSDIGRPFQ